MNLDLKVLVEDNLLGSYYLKTTGSIGINNFKELCSYVENMSSMIDGDIIIEWFIDKNINQNIISSFKKDIFSRPDLFSI